MTHKIEQPKKKHATKAEMVARNDALFTIVERMRPMTVRQVFYQAEVASIVEKTEAGYDKVQRALVAMRRDGKMPYGWITDGTRYRQHPSTFPGIEAALEYAARTYRKSLWDDSKVYVEVWCEKDALSGVIYPVTSLYDVSLMVARGYSSLSFLAASAEEITTIGKPAFIYHLGDYDPSGQDAARKVEETLRELAPNAEIHFERLAVTPQQIRWWSLPTRPTKTTDSRAKNFGAESVELDSISPDDLRTLVKDAIERHLPEWKLNALKEVETVERETITAFVRQDPRRMHRLPARSQRAHAAVRRRMATTPGTNRPSATLIRVASVLTVKSTPRRSSKISRAMP
jgi:hypothetical protein